MVELAHLLRQTHPDDWRNWVNTLISHNQRHTVELVKLANFIQLKTPCETSAARSSHTARDTLLELMDSAFLFQIYDIFDRFFMRIFFYIALTTEIGKKYS